MHKYFLLAGIFLFMTCGDNTTAPSTNNNNTNTCDGQVGAAYFYVVCWAPIDSSIACYVNNDLNDTGICALGFDKVLFIIHINETVTRTDQYCRVATYSQEIIAPATLDLKASYFPYPGELSPRVLTVSVPYVKTETSGTMTFTISNNTTNSYSRLGKTYQGANQIYFDPITITKTFYSTTTDTIKVNFRVHKQ